MTAETPITDFVDDDDDDEEDDCNDTHRDHSLRSKRLFCGKRKSCFGIAVL